MRACRLVLLGGLSLVINVSTARAVDISGTLLEDLNADANLADGVGRGGVEVRAYLDDGDNG